MIIVKTTNGDRFINEAEILQVSHVKELKVVKVYYARRCTPEQMPAFDIVDVESVVYNNDSMQWEDEGLELKELKAKYDEHIEWGKEIRAKYMELMAECDDMRERLSKLEPDYENDRLVDTVYNEIDRMETEERERQRRKHPNWTVYKKGHGIRFLNIAKANEIETVGQLLALGRAKFKQFKYMGPKCIAEVSQALENLYGIKQW